MGLFNFLQNKFSRGPAIVSTANTLAKHFLKVLKENPNMSRQEIYLEVLRQRYDLLPIDSLIQEELSRQINDKLGFKGFVLDVLNAETELSNTHPEFIWKVSNVIEEELKKYSELPR